MTKQGSFKSKAFGFIVTLLICLMAGPFAASDKKIQVVSSLAEIRLNPDETSPLIESLPKGTVLSLNYSGIMKKAWYYVSFKSEKSKVMKSGYIRISDVELLFQAQKVVEISGEDKIKNDIEPILRLVNHDQVFKAEDVIDQEGQPSQADSSPGLDILSYQKKILGQDCMVEYVFSSGRLVGTRLNFSKIYQDKNQSIALYKNLKAWLSETFGRPEDDQEEWRNIALKADVMSWGHAVSQGHLRYNSLWSTTKTDISLNLSGENSEIDLELNCAEKSFNNLAKKEM